MYYYYCYYFYYYYYLNCQWLSWEITPSVSSYLLRLVSASPGHVWMECCPTQWAWATHTHTYKSCSCNSCHLAKVCLFLCCNVCFSVGWRNGHLPAGSHTAAQQGAPHSFSHWRQVAQVCVSAPAVKNALRFHFFCFPAFGDLCFCLFMFAQRQCENCGRVRQRLNLSPKG